ncbi:MAG: InlB B-repeat-containing protein, partial [Clostridiales bacterium]|nr:InlB B-repeat-containing protein [Clostridiales bacterium]
MKQTKVKAILIFAILCLTAVFVLSACEVKNCNVVFLNDGEVYLTATVKKGKTVNLPNDPAKDGYAFGGWVYSDDGNAAFDASQKITGDIVLTAKWVYYAPELLFTPITGGYRVSVGTMTNATEIVIPQEYNGKPVLSIDNTFKSCTKLVKLTIPFVGATLDGTSNTHFGYIFGANNVSSYIPSPLKEVIVTGGTSL